MFAAKLWELLLEELALLYLLLLPEELLHLLLVPQELLAVVVLEEPVPRWIWASRSAAWAYQFLAA